VSSFNSRSVPGSSSKDETSVPTACPSCKSSSIVTTAKNPDVDSYWRCTSCGDVWNNSRNHAPRFGGRPWR
jgi:predicted Zn finger-like uncharacterized protein